MNAADSPVQTAAGRGLLACHHCGTVWRGAQVHEPCARCGTRLHRRKPDSLNRTWALVIAAAILYLPANLLPVMITRTIFGAQYDTIMSGIIYFWVSGAWGLAAIIFIASFLVPLFKLAALAIMAWSAGRHSDWRRQERATLYIDPGTAVYEGMIVGLNSRPGDMDVNPTKEKKLTNIRTHSHDEALRLVPPPPMTLETAIESIAADELVEVTPTAIRMRKRTLSLHERRRERGREEDRHRSADRESG